MVSYVLWYPAPLVPQTPCTLGHKAEARKQKLFGCYASRAPWQPLYQMCPRVPTCCASLVTHHLDERSNPALLEETGRSCLTSLRAGGANSGVLRRGSVPAALLWGRRGRGTPLPDGVVLLQSNRVTSLWVSWYLV